MEQKGFTLWFTGLSGAGKTTLARLVETELSARGHKVEVLDGDIIRTNLSKGLGFSKEDRDTNIRRIGFVCDLLTRNDVVAIAAAISPYREVREEVRRDIGAFVEVYVSCPINVLAERDVKGLYKKALAGEIKNFTGVDDPYESPLAPEVIVETDIETPEQSAARIIAKLEEMSLVAADDGIARLDRFWIRIDRHFACRRWILDLKSQVFRDAQLRTKCLNPDSVHRFEQADHLGFGLSRALPSWRCRNPKIQNLKSEIDEDGNHRAGRRDVRHHRAACERGSIAGLSRLMREGVSAPLRSTILPNSFPGWASCTTGTSEGHARSLLAVYQEPFEIHRSRDERSRHNDAVRLGYRDRSRRTFDCAQCSDHLSA